MKQRLGACMNAVWKVQVGQIVSNTQMKNPKDEEDEEDFCGWLDVVNFGGRGVGIYVHVIWMCDTMGWWPEGADDHVSLLTSECIWDRSPENEAPFCDLDDD